MLKNSFTKQIMKHKIVAEVLFMEMFYGILNPEPQGLPHDAQHKSKG